MYNFFQPTLLQNVGLGDGKPSFFKGQPYNNDYRRKNLKRKIVKRNLQGTFI